MNFPTKKRIPQGVPRLFGAIGVLCMLLSRGILASLLFVFMWSYYAVAIVLFLVSIWQCNPWFKVVLCVFDKIVKISTALWLAKAGFSGSVAGTLIILLKRSVWVAWVEKDVAEFESTANSIQLSWRTMHKVCL